MMTLPGDPSPATLAELACAVKAEARALGFDLVGIANAEPSAEAETRTLAWLARGDAAGMAWITAERIRRSCRPAELLPNARSFLAVAIGYRPAEEARRPPPARDAEHSERLPETASTGVSISSHRENGVGVSSSSSKGSVGGSSSSYSKGGVGVSPTSTPLSPSGGEGGRGERGAPLSAPLGEVARYARGRDYHDLLKPRLWALVRFLERQLGRSVAARVFVDDGPCSDRAVAQRAGLGFFGKNTNLLTRTHGSYVLLGAALTDVPLPPDPPALGDCGSCTLCLDACPTGALPAPFRLDSSRCISYLTIEQRGSIPEPYRARIGSHLFGCDVCQEVCPWNRLAASTGEAAFAPDAGAGAALEPASVLALDETAYRERLRGSPLKRAKRQGLRRNAALVLGNVGGDQARPALAAAVSDPDPVVAEHAAWALARLDERAP